MGKRENKTKQLPDEKLTKEEQEALEHDWLVEMVGEEDAAYFEAAGIDGIGNK